MNPTLLLALLVTSSLCAADFRVENSTVLNGTEKYHWSQSRPAVLPNGRVIVTTREIENQ